MKKTKFIVFLSMVLVTLLVFTACDMGKKNKVEKKSASSSSFEKDKSFSNSDSEKEESDIFGMEKIKDIKTIFYGIVTEVTDGGVLVKELLPPIKGNDFESLMFFNIDKTTEIIDPDNQIKEGSFVVIEYNGIVAVSYPPQATATKIEYKTDVAPEIIAGAILKVEEDDNNIYITIDEMDYFESVIVKPRIGEREDNSKLEDIPYSKQTKIDVTESAATIIQPIIEPPIELIIPASEENIVLVITKTALGKYKISDFKVGYSVYGIHIPNSNDTENQKHMIAVFTFKIENY